MRIVKTIILLLFVPIVLPAQNYDFVVDVSGSGNFTTLQAAIDACPDNVRKTIFVKNGTYNEKILIGSHSKVSNKLLNIVGENADSVIITWDDYNGKTIIYEGKTITSGTPQSATFTVNAVDFYAENLTIQNTYTTKQAVALYNVADRQTFKNCRIIGFQDTHYLKKGRRSYFYNCYIEGGTDYICAGGTALFENCTLHSIKNSSYITAPEDIVIYRSVGAKKYYYGFVFLNCNLISDNSIEVYLGRPWQGTSSSIFLNCTMQNIKPQGWSVWSDNNHLTSFFAEYKSKNPDGTLIDTTQRVDWSYQLTDEEVQQYYKREDVFSHNNFTIPYNPFPLVGITSLPAAEWQELQAIVKCEIFDITGAKILEENNREKFSIVFTKKLKSGIYIMLMTDINGKKLSKKTIITH
jgi:pectin methylesterase-like acyl-CoA thioesterase